MMVSKKKKKKLHVVPGGTNENHREGRKKHELQNQPRGGFFFIQELG